MTETLKPTVLLDGKTGFNAESKTKDLQVALDNVGIQEVMEQFGQAMDVVAEHTIPGDSPIEAIDRTIELSKWAVLGIGLGRAEAKTSGENR